MASHDHYYNILLNQYCSLSHLTITIMEILPPKSLPNKLLGSMSLVLFLISYFVAPPLMGFFLCAYVSVGVWWVCTLCVHGVVCVLCACIVCACACTQWPLPQQTCQPLSIAVQGSISRRVQTTLSACAHCVALHRNWYNSISTTTVEYSCKH